MNAVIAAADEANRSSEGQIIPSLLVFQGSVIRDGYVSVGHAIELLLNKILGRLEGPRLEERVPLGRSAVERDQRIKLGTRVCFVSPYVRNNVLLLVIIRIEMNSQAGVGSTVAKSQVLLYRHLLPSVRRFVFTSPFSLTGD